MKAHKNQPASAIGANARSVIIVAILAVTVLIIVWIYRPRATEPLGVVHCPDGTTHPVIDATQFATQYWGYSFKLEGSLSNKGKAAAALEPRQMQQLSEALQQGNEFRKWLVNSYNACAVRQTKYEEYGASFQGMDNAARNIQQMIDQGVKTPAERASLAALVNTYLQLARGLQPATSRSNP